MKWQNDLHLDTGDDMLLIGFINAAPWLSGSLMYVVSQLEPNWEQSQHVTLHSTLTTTTEEHGWATHSKKDSGDAPRSSFLLFSVLLLS